MEILIHEAMHIMNPGWEEDQVIKQSQELTKLLWKEHFRKVDNGEGPPLQ